LQLGVDGSKLGERVKEKEQVSAMGTSSGMARRIDGHVFCTPLAQTTYQPEWIWLDFGPKYTTLTANFQIWKVRTFSVTRLGVGLTI
jgi:hypothetical protein